MQTCDNVEAESEFQSNLQNIIFQLTSFRGIAVADFVSQSHVQISIVPLTKIAATRQEWRRRIHIAGALSAGVSFSAYRLSLVGLGFADGYAFIDDSVYVFLLGSYSLPRVAALFFLFFCSRMWSSCMVPSTLFRVLFSSMQGCLVEFEGGDRDGCNDDRGRDG